MTKILIIGCGAIGYQLAECLADKGHDVTGLKRTLPAVLPTTFKMLAADITSPIDLNVLESDFEHIFFIVSANRHDENSYHAVYDTGLNNLLTYFAGRQCNAAWIFVSSTSVYGQSLGEWVDEDSMTLPTALSSLKIVNAERTLQLQNPKNTVVRFSGIYGPGREYLLKMARNTPIIQRDPPYYTNRIHQQDCVAILVFLLEHRLQNHPLEQCYLASDDNPAPLWEVISWMAHSMAYAPPIEKPMIANSDNNKRCKNTRLKKLGYHFLYPDYKTGYSELLGINQQP